ncbi:MAG: hypothetical protein ACRDAG_12490 [Cetobacterium somerae]|uniref:hypothetical protein n=1 Tax=Cetobacterium somerae TaxID=188913 RepID=UPI003F2DBFCE
MKKILLGLLALSAISFANPGTDNSSSITINSQLEVLPANTKLVIEELLPNGNWQPVTSSTLFDHGKVIASAAGSVNVPQSNVVKNFRIKRSTGTITGGKTTITFRASATPLSAISSGNLTTANNPTGNFTIGTIPHTFRLSMTEYTHPGAGLPYIPFDIASHVPTISANQLAGIYNRTEDITVLLQ